VISPAIPRAALVTGGPRPFGLAIARALAGAGFAIALQCHAEVTPGVPAGIVVLPADLSDETQAAGLLNRAVSVLGPIGVLVNNATTVEHDAWDDATRATWDMHIETNLRAPFVLIQHFAKALSPPHEGVAINLLDQRITPRLVSYTLSKAALWTLTQTMALALAPRIRVNGIDPNGPALGTVRGPSHEQSVSAYDGANPEDVAEEVSRAMLAILALPSMTGQMIVPNGVPRSEA
jgi:NAD(P)-dependent dehydrogenase (short-subunit alcohol dehydrogenase family)